MAGKMDDVPLLVLQQALEIVLSQRLGWIRTDDLGVVESERVLCLVEERFDRVALRLDVRKLAELERPAANDDVVAKTAGVRAHDEAAPETGRAVEQRRIRCALAGNVAPERRVDHPRVARRRDWWKYGLQRDFVLLLPDREDHPCVEQTTRFLHTLFDVVPEGAAGAEKAGDDSATERGELRFPVRRKLSNRLGKRFTEVVRPEIEGKGPGALVLKVHAAQIIGPAIIGMRRDLNVQALRRRLGGPDLTQELCDVAVSDRIRSYVAADHAHAIAHIHGER